jgi:hypothetical protein
LESGISFPHILIPVVVIACWGVVVAAVVVTVRAIERRKLSSSEGEPGAATRAHR